METNAHRDADARLRILRVATHLFAERGYAATSVQAIAEQVGIRKQSVLHHFASKEELHREVLSGVLSRWGEVVPRIFAAADGGKGRIEGIIAELVTFFSEDPDRARLLTRELLDRPDHMRQLIESHTKRWTALVCEAIREGQAAGTVYEDVNPEAYVAMMAMLISSGVGQLRVIDVLIEPEGANQALHVYTRELIRIAQRSLFRPRSARGEIP